MRPRRLYARIYLYTLAVLFLVAICTGAVFSSLWRPALLHGPAERVARRVAQRVSARLHEPAARAQLVRELAEDFDVDVTLRDDTGHLLAVAGAELPALPQKDLSALHGGPLIVSHHRFRGWFAAAPLYEPGAKDRGHLVGVLAVSVLRRAPHGSLARPLGVLSVVLLLVAIFTLPLSRRITRPIEQISEANRRLGAGDLTYRIPLRCDRHGRFHDDELHQLQRSWNDMAGRIEALLSSQKELLANVSHELRSPLSRIRVALALLPEEGAHAERIRDVEEDLGELERLIDDVLTTSRLEASGLPLRREPVAALPLLRALAERAGAGVTVSVEEGAGPTLLADGSLLKRALWNLVENALKYGASPITLSAGVEGDFVLFHIADEGSGVAKEERGRVLEPFYRSDRARTPGGPGGFGLGLTLARRIAEAHGGALTLGPCRSEGVREIGLRVTLRVPARPSSPTTPDR